MMMEHKGYRLPQDLLLIFWALLRLVYYEIIIHRRPLPEILREIREMKASSSPAPEAVMSHLDKLWRACGFWMERLFRSPRPCLRRALVLYYWCRKHGIESQVFVGVGKDGDVLKGHAWLSVYGQVYREDPTTLESDYVVMLEG
jgi:hypothetical protein